MLLSFCSCDGSGGVAYYARGDPLVDASFGHGKIIIKITSNEKVFNIKDVHLVKTDNLGFGVICDF